MGTATEKGVRIPDRFREVDVGRIIGDTNIARREIKEAHGKIVLVKDFHLGADYRTGTLEYDENDKECYYLNTEKGRIKLCFNDLENLLIGRESDL